MMVVAALLVSSTLSAAPAPPATGKEGAKEANGRGMKLYRAKDYGKAAEEFRAAIALDDAYVLARYNLASMAALTGDRATVLAQLRWLRASQDPAAARALARAGKDPDLRPVIDDPEVKKLIGADGGGPASGAAAAGGGGCEAGCEKAGEACSGRCDDRGCMRICDSEALDCKNGCAAGMGAEARARMRAWLDSPLTGSDNGFAKLRKAAISRKGYAENDDDADVYESFVQNQFGFTCVLEWGTDGSPAKLKGCKAATAGYTATPAEIPLRCGIDRKKKRETCEGSYHLQADNLDDATAFKLQRAFK